ncbi:LytTr DNA-binding domain-containing protein [Gluconacetobacter liquefaciens]|nr:LytTR family DNA-binding domain-containing protein [Gluconacetobacter liquefaciens]RDI38120.1 LytTr DNA-binding domain-containing protein [Gluconacetobacter liquefaciens]
MGQRSATRGVVSGELAPARVSIADGVPCRDFLGRHAPDLAGARLLALAAEDHYLRIHTDRGQALALLRLRDAIDSLGEEAGLQVHRSFWVAMHAAPLAARRGQSWQLELPSGLSIPVSKARVAACRAVGWL